MVFCRVFEPRDIEKEWRSQTVSLKNPPSCSSVFSWIKSGMVQAVVNGRNLLRGHGEEPGNVGGGRLADGDDPMLAMREAAGDDPPVKHALPIIFPGEVKGSQIVDCCDERAGPAPHHSPIAGHVKQIEAFGPGQPGQNGLMPNNVLYRGSKPLGNENNPGRPTGKIEQRRVLLQNEKA